MSFLTEIEGLGEKVESFLTTIVKGASTLQKIWGSLSGPVLAAGAAVFYDVVTTLASGESAAAAAAGGNVTQAITLSETTYGLVQKVIADAKAGVATVKTDFDNLGIKL